MAKPLTKGPAISFRLPLALHHELHARAQAMAESDADCAARLLAEVLQGRQEHPVARPRPVQGSLDTPTQALDPLAPVEMPLPVHACPHIDYKRYSFGMWECKDCGARSRDLGRTWTTTATGGGG